MSEQEQEGSEKHPGKGSILFSVNGLLGKIWTKIADNLVLALLAPAGVAAWVVWGDVQNYLNQKAANFIIENVQDDMKKGEQSIILNNAREFMTKQASEFIGQLSAGSFSFSELNREQRLNIVSAPNHKAYLLIETNKLPEGYRIELQPDCARTVPKAVEKSGVALIPLDQVISDTGKETCKTNRSLNVLTGDAEIAPSYEIVETLGQRIRNMYSFTLKLVGPSKDFRLATPVLVRYLATVNPPLSTGDLQLKSDVSQ